MHNITNINYPLKLKIIALAMIFCSIWFIFDYRFAPKSSFYVITGIKLLLILGVFIDLKIPKHLFNYTINFILLWVIFTEIVLNQNSPFKLVNTIFGNNLLLIFLLPFYFKKQWELEIFIKIFILYIFFTVICVGFYQNFVGVPIFDFYRFHDTSTIYNIENMRFTGLIYPDTTVAANALGLFTVYYLIKNFFQKKSKVFIIAASTIGFTALALTLTRGAWIAILITILGFFFWKRGKITFTTKSFVLTVLILLISLLFLNYFYENYLSRDFSNEISRLSTNDTFYYRLTRYTLFLFNILKVPFSGFGIIQDPAESLRQVIGQFKWGTVHNQIFEFTIAFGILFSIFIYYRMGRAISILLKYSNSRLNNRAKFFFSFLIFSQLFIFINEMAASNIYYFSLFVLTISEIAINNINTFDLSRIHEKQGIT